MRNSVSLFLVLVATGCAYSHNTTRPKQDLVGAGDCLVIRIENGSVTAVTRIVDSDGTIEFPFLGKVTVTGMTLDQVGATLRERFQPAELPEPTLAVSRCRE